MDPTVGESIPDTVRFRVTLDVLIAIQEPLSNGRYARGEPLVLYADRLGRAVEPPWDLCASLDDDDGLISEGEGEARYAERVVKEIADALRRKDLEATSLLTPIAPSIDLGGKASRDLQDTWIVSVEPSLVENQEQVYGWVGVRIASPVYGPDGEDCAFRDGLTQVLACLDENFIAIVNSDTRIRVLVGPAQGTLDLGELKGIASLLWAADRLLAEVHPAHCGPGSLRALGIQYTALAGKSNVTEFRRNMMTTELIEDPWSQRLSPNRRLLTLLRRPEPLDLPKYQNGLRDIHAASSIEGLIDLFEVHPAYDGEVDDFTDMAYSFRELARAGGSTISFNQHCGTLDAPSILSWTALCTSLVARGIEISFENSYAVVRSLQRRIHGETTTLAGFLGQLGLTNTAQYYGSRDPGMACPDMLQWPRLRNSIPADESKPRIEAMLESVVPREDLSEETLDRILDDFSIAIHEWKESPGNAADSRYTFGIEMEMLVPCEPLPEEKPPAPKWVASQLGDSAPSQSRQLDNRKIFHGDIADRVQNMIKVMHSLGLPAICTKTLENTMVNPLQMLQRAAREQGMFLNGNLDATYQFWGVEVDLSLTSADKWKGYDGLNGIEIASPILRATPDCWKYILDAVSGLRREMKLAVDDTCGLHVSIGKGEQPMSFLFFKKVACLAFLADYIIFSLCHPSRRVGRYSNSFRDKSRMLHEYSEEWDNLPLTPEFDDHFPVDQLSDKDCALLKWLWTVDSWADFRKMTTNRSLDRCCVSFLRIFPVPCQKGPPYVFEGSIEFRYLQGTLDPEMIIRFSQLMVAMVKFADTAPPEAWQAMARNALLVKNCWDYDWDILETFLGHLDLGDEYEYWMERAHENRMSHACFSEENFRRKDFDHSVRQKYLDDISIAPPVPKERIEHLLANVCRRERLLEYPTDDEETTEPNIAPTYVKVGALGRAEALLRICGPNKTVINKAMKGHHVVEEIDTGYLKHRLAKLELTVPESDSTRIELPVNADSFLDTCLEAYEEDGFASLAKCVKRHMGGDLLGVDDLEVEELEDFVDQAIPSDAPVGGWDMIEGTFEDDDLTEAEWDKFFDSEGLGYLEMAS